MEKEIFDTKEYTLENGLKILTIKKDTRLFSINAGIKIGSLYEEKKERGIAHFIEHMLFKGTKKRNNERLNSELEELAGEYNAYTEYNSTVYSITALNEELSSAIEIISDMLQNSIFSKSEIEKERKVILSEIKTGKDDVEDYSFKKINEIAFKKSSLKYEIVGEEESVKSFSRKELVDYYKRYYVPNNCYISIVSPYEHEQILKIVENEFKEWKSEQFSRKEIISEDNCPVKKISYKKEIEQASIIYLFTFHNLNKIEELALKILDHKFGGSTNSVLFREVREKNGLAYDIYSEMNVTKGIKTLYIYTSVSKENVEETIKIIDECIEKVKNEEIPFDDKTIKLMKKVIKTAVASTLEDSTDLGDYALHQCIDGESVYECVDDMKKLEEIKKEDIYLVARKVLRKPTIHILLPEEGE